MSKMKDVVRAWWNDLGERFTDPAKLAQLNISDIEYALNKAKDAAASFIGRPTILKKEIEDLKKKDTELVSKIKVLKTEDDLKPAERLAEVLLDVRNELQHKEGIFLEASEVAEAWKSRIKTLERELLKRRTEANDLKERQAAADAMIKLGIAVEAVDRHTRSNPMSRLEFNVKALEQKSAGYMALSGLDDSVFDEQVLRKTEIKNLLNSL